MNAKVVGTAFLGLLAGANAEAQQASGSLQRCVQAAIAKQPGTFVKVEIETAGTSSEAGSPPEGTALLELEVRGADGTVWELTCDEKTGRIVEVEQEVRDAADARFKAKAKVSEEEARKTALAAHPGSIVEAEYEIEANGAATYEFDVKPTSGTGELKIEVDATTGKLVERRQEHHQIGVEPSAGGK